MFGYGKRLTHFNAHTLTKKNIKVGFNAMDNKTEPSKIYTTININNHGSDQEEYTLDVETNHNQSQQWREESTTT